MHRSAFIGLFAGSSLLFLNVAAAQDSGPGPKTGSASRQYNVAVIKVSATEQGTLTFARSVEVPPAIVPSSNGIATDQPNGTAGDDSTGGANPTTTGELGSGTTTTVTSTTETTSEPPSYWTRARANGRVTSRTNDSTSSDYWTPARARGEVVPGDTSGNASGGPNESSFTSGAFAANFADDSTTGTWYAVDLGTFSLWYANSDSASSDETFAGYATPTTIGGRTSTGTGTGGILEAIFTGSFFSGTSDDSEAAE